MKVVVLADTHIRDDGSTRFSERAWSAVRTADVILHAGDVTGARLLDELQRVGRGRVHAVLGNNDAALVDVLPETVELDLDGVSVAMIHDTGARAGRERRVHRCFPDADVVVFGHSHIPWNEEGIHGQLLFNPGSAVQRRRQPHRTIGELVLSKGRIRSAQIVVVDP
jgi:putative phosphoesterase